MRICTRCNERVAEEDVIKMTSLDQLNFSVAEYMLQFGDMHYTTAYHGGQDGRIGCWIERVLCGPLRVETEAERKAWEYQEQLENLIGKKL